MCSHVLTNAQCQTAYCYTGGFIFAGATQGELPEGQEKVPWGMTSSRRFSSNYTNFINLYLSTAAFILHFPLSILNSPLT